MLGLVGRTFRLHSRRSLTQLGRKGAKLSGSGRANDPTSDSCSTIRRRSLSYVARIRKQAEPSASNRSPASIKDPVASSDSSNQFLRHSEEVAREQTLFFKESSRVGSMTPEDWGKSRRLLIDWAKKFRVPEMAEKMLDRLVEESHHNRHFTVNATLYNLCLDAWGKSSDDGARKAETLLHKMQSRHQQRPSVDPAPNAISYETVLHAWARSTESSATEKAEEIISTMQQLGKHNPSLAPTERTYNFLILAYANRAGEYGSAKAAEDVLLRLSELHSTGLGPETVSTVSFNTVLKAWANSGDDKAPDRALEILHLMLKLQMEGHENIAPDSISVSTVIHAFAKQGKAERAEEVLKMVEKDDSLSGIDLTSSYNSCLDGWAKSHCADAGKRAEQLMQRGIASGRLDPDVITYSSCMEAHAQSATPIAAENAERFLRHMIDSFQSGRTNVRPSISNFHCVMHCWAKGNDSNAAVRAESLLSLMEDLAQSRSFQCTPDFGSYSMCIDAWCKSRAPESAGRALALLERLEEAFAKGRGHLCPQSFNYTRVINKLASSWNGRSINSMEAAAVLSRMVRQWQLGMLDASPTTDTFNIVISALSRTGTKESVDTGTSVLHDMELMHEEGNCSVRPGAKAYTSLLQGLTRLGGQDALRRAAKLSDNMWQLEKDCTHPLRLDKKAFRALLLALAKTREPWAGLKAGEVLRRMFELHENGRFECEPDSKCLSIGMKTAARNVVPEDIPLAHELLQAIVRRYRERVTTQLPDRTAFHAVIGAWSRLATEEAKKKVYGIVGAMETLAHLGNSQVRPNEATYTTLINLLMKSNVSTAAEEAEALLLSIDNSERGSIVPDTVMWNSVILTWARSAAPNKALRARQVLDKMLRKPAVGNARSKPDVSSYNTVLNAAAFTNGNSKDRKDALAVAETTMEELRSSPFLAPDHDSFKTMNKVYKHLLPAGEAQEKALQRIREEIRTTGVADTSELRKTHSEQSQS